MIDKAFSQRFSQHIINSKCIFERADGSSLSDCSLRYIDKFFLPFWSSRDEVVNSLITQNINFHSLGTKTHAFFVKL